MYKKINLSFARLLLRLSKGEQISLGEFKGNESKKLLKIFQDDKILDWTPIGKQQRKYYCSDKKALLNYLQNNHEINTGIEEYISYLENHDSERSDAARITSDSKFKNEKVLKGFLINSFNPVVSKLNGNQFHLSPVSGACTFISDFKGFIVDESITVVGVENLDNLIKIETQRHLFCNINPLFLWRFQNSSLIIEWLKMNSNPYLHFGDFDLKGVHIYITEFRNKLEEGRCRFFIPDNIEELIEHGSRKRFEDQYKNLKNFNFFLYPEIKELIALIFREKRGLHQEILIGDKHK